MGKVMVGAPVRNRAWILPRHIEGIQKQEDVYFQTCYILNDCTDNTEEILKRHGFHYVKKDMGRLKTVSEHRALYSFAHLARLRNALLEEFLQTDCEYLFSCDTDVIIPEGSLLKLIHHDVDIISMVIRNHPSMMAHNVINNYRHLVKIPYGLIPCEITGAVYLIKRKIIEAGVKYRSHRMGEDVPFCEDAKRKGFRIYCDTTLRPIHAYARGIDLVASVMKPS